MENITIGQIASALTTLGIIVGAFIKVKKSMTDCYNKKVVVKFEEVDKKFKEVDKKIVEIENRLSYVERKREEYEKELGDSKKEREILMMGELSALKLLWSMVDESKIEKDDIGKSIKNIEDYVIKKIHD